MRSRLTFVVSPDRARSWERFGVLSCRSVADVPRAIAAHDVERIVVDRCASAEEYLQLLAHLTHEVRADVLLIRENGLSFLSAVGRGGDRVLYALSADDVEFYLQIHGLAAAPDLALIA